MSIIIIGDGLDGINSHEGNISDTNIPNPLEIKGCLFIGCHILWKKVKLKSNNYIIITSF
jgi:hypothetical protein